VKSELKPLVVAAKEEENGEEEVATNFVDMKSESNKKPLDEGETENNDNDGQASKKFKRV
jgi:hypothetical protein